MELHRSMGLVFQVQGLAGRPGRAKDQAAAPTAVFGSGVWRISKRRLRKN